MKVKKVTRRLSAGGYAFTARRGKPKQEAAPSAPPKAPKAIEYRDPDSVPMPWDIKRPYRPRKRAVRPDKPPKPPKPPKVPKAAKAKPDKPPKVPKPRKLPKVRKVRPFRIIQDPAAEVGCTAPPPPSYYPAAWDDAERRLAGGQKQARCLTCLRWRWGDEGCGKQRLESPPAAKPLALALEAE